MLDDERIRQLRDEVLGQIGGALPPAELEQRVAALEAAVARLERHGAAAPAVAAAPTALVQLVTHPSLRVLDVPSGGERCVLEPDKPCTQTGTCRSLGH
jgi:hypothetical protein